METKGNASGTIRGRDGEMYSYDVSWVLLGETITWDAVSRVDGTERTRRKHLAGVVRHSPEDDLEWWVMSAVGAEVEDGAGRPL